MEIQEMTWQELVDDLFVECAQTEKAYLIFERETGNARRHRVLREDEYWALAQSAKPLHLGKRLAEVAISYDGEPMLRYVAVDHCDPRKAIYLQKSGKGYLGNSNAQKGRYPRTVISLVGPGYDLLRDQLKAEGDEEPTPDEIVEAVNKALLQVHGRTL